MSIRDEVARALTAFDGAESITDPANALFATLGYHSERSDEVGGLAAFMDLLGEEKPLTDRQRGLLAPWRSADIVLQVTGDEIRGCLDMFQEFDRGLAKSFLFVTADLEDRVYSRTELADMTRVVNRGFAMPVVVLFRHGATLTLAAVHRRAHKRDGERDVLERVTLVKDIHAARPHRAHVDILVDLALPPLVDDGVRDFDGLHAAWERVLDIEALNRRFYGELFAWFQRAVGDCRFPDDGAGEGAAERHVIRLVTRLLFIWFLKEKGLVPERLFDEGFARAALKRHAPESTDYYRAVLQNLFFATLNTEIGKRAFSTKNRAAHRDFTKYRYRSLLRDPDGFVELLRSVPFVNGGLFDCLDDFAAAGAGGRRIDAFTDNDDQRRDLDVPARMFFDPKHGLFPLFRRYKFTVEENTPLDREVALDPELLGRAFENLLAAYNPETRETARKATGSYYTPRRVVDYMVREVLAEALAAKTGPVGGDDGFHRERLQYLLDHSDAMDDADGLFEDREKRAVVVAIAGLRTLDPAVGSGAFPMGILQTLTLALRRLDPDNTLWEELQKERAKARAGTAFDTGDRERRDESLREISATFEKYRRSDYGRKLYLIQNGIYGADIQPVACQIAKLRFFISLVIEQEPDSGAPNLGLEPLPNLETRFVAADTLIGLRAEAASLLHGDAVETKRRELAAVRERYFLADNRQKKLACIADERRLRGELRESLEIARGRWLAARERDIETKVQALPNRNARGMFRDAALKELAGKLRAYDAALEDARRVAEWDPYDQNRCAEWFDAEHMFGVGAGFDVLIGNPPYVESRNKLMSSQAKLAYGNQVRADWDAVLPRGSDKLIYFMARAPKFLGHMGTGCFITQNAWLSTDYGLAFQTFTTGRFSFHRIIDTSAKFFSDSKGPNINAIIALFTRRQVATIKYAVADANMAVASQRTIQIRPSTKWGHLFAMPPFFEDMLDVIARRQVSNLVDEIHFGQGVYVPKSKLGRHGANLGIIVDDPQFAVERPDAALHPDDISASRAQKYPALVMPRGVGDRHYCAFNTCKAFSFSKVELYLPEELWESGIHYCLWAYLNSSLVWLFREITGRMNLGGGMLKAEATDMKALPVSFQFDFASAARELFTKICGRKPLPVSPGDRHEGAHID